MSDAISPPSLEPRRFDWNKNLVCPLIVALVAGYVGYRLNDKSPHLTFTVQDTMALENNDIGLKIVSIKSDGSKAAKDVKCNIHAGATIEEIKAAPDDFGARTKKEGDKATVTLDLLNVGEALEVVARVRNSARPTPTVVVRGDYVVGEHKPPLARPGDSSGQLVLIFLVA